jgi:hypothetical protein
MSYIITALAAIGAIIAAYFMGKRDQNNLSKTYYREIEKNAQKMDYDIDHLPVDSDRVRKATEFAKKVNAKFE